MSASGTDVPKLSHRSVWKQAGKAASTQPALKRDCSKTWSVSAPARLCRAAATAAAGGARRKLHILHRACRLPKSSEEHRRAEHGTASGSPSLQWQGRTWRWCRRLVARPCCALCWGHLPQTPALPPATTSAPHHVGSLGDRQRRQQAVPRSETLPQCATADVWRVQGSKGLADTPKLHRTNVGISSCSQNARF